MKIEDLLKEMRAKMDKSVRFVHDEFATLRTGKASPTLVENITVDYYGAPTRLKEIAGITTPEPRMILIQPWDASVAGAIVKAISASNIGITPLSDGKVVRLPIPELDEERRLELQKVAGKMAEEARVSLRNIRRETNDEIKTMRKAGDISEDDMFREENNVQKATDDHINKVDQLLAHKEKEIMEV